jgi:hypothetical protein
LVTINIRTLLHMAIPFKNVAGDPNHAAEDSYNLYHSQLCICGECAFGMLVLRWGLLWMAVPWNLSVQKVVGIVNALAKLHNFCIEESKISEQVLLTLCRDNDFMMNNMKRYLGLDVDNSQLNTMVPTNPMHAGEHFNNIPATLLCYHWGIMCNLFLGGHWERPTPTRAR